MTRIVILCLFISSICYGALSKDIQWDVRTTGADTNSGGFDPTVAAPGTDESMGAVGTAYTDILIDAATTKASSVLNPFTATTHGPGNTLVITGGVGCTTGIYEMLSQAAGLATFDSALGVAGSTCTGVLGGSFLTIGKALSVSDASHTINIQSGTYVVTATLTVSDDLLSIIGYQTTHDDSGTKPLITTATDSVHLFTFGAGMVFGVMVKNLSLSNTAAVRADGLADTGSYMQLSVIDCILDGFRYGINGDTDGQVYSGLYVYGSEIKNSTVDGILSRNGVYVTDSYIHNNAGIGVNCTNSSSYVFMLLRNILANNVGYGASYNTSNTSYGSMVINNTFYGNGGGFIIPVVYTYAPGSGFALENNIFYGNASYGVRLSAIFAGANKPYQNRNNAYGANNGGGVGLDRLNLGAGYNSVTLLANPFTGATDYSLNNTAGGGALLKQTGFPGVFPGGLSTGFIDIGAVQASGAGSGTSAYGHVN